MTLCLQAPMTKHLKVQTQCLRSSLVKWIRFLGGEGITINFLKALKISESINILLIFEFHLMKTRSSTFCFCMPIQGYTLEVSHFSF